VKSKLVLLFAFCILLFISCDWESIESDLKTFDYNLQGTWITNNPDSTYSGRLEITKDRITITGYGESQTQIPWGNDAERPFRAFTKGAALKGYSEEGHFYIEDAGMWQAGIPYIYWDDSPPPDYRKVYFLRFEFGGRTETLRRQ
jgi:hypothetical protein